MANAAVSPPVASSSTLSPGLSASSANRSNRSAPTQSLKAASVLGARPITSSTYQARNGFAITPDSSAPPSPPIAPLQPSIRALPPPISANASSGSRPSFSQTSTSSGPNYNVTLSPQAPNMSMSLQPTSSGFMQPLQPQTSSMASHSPAALPSGIQWNTIAPPNTSASVQWSSATPLAPKPATGPPGWGGNAVMQPTKKETTFDWGDLDPMR
jgi:SCY1-like protein 2